MGLRAQIQASGQSRGGRDQYAQAEQRQQFEIQRTQDYAASVGCGNPAYNDFDASQPEQCAGIENRLQRMQDNLAALQQRRAQLDQDAGAQAQLLARYNAYCSQEAPDNTPVIQDLEPDRSAGHDPSELQTVPVDPDQISNAPDHNIIGDAESPRRLGQAICVRSCDGGYFPLGRNATQDQVDSLEQLCKASCPNTEAHLYTMPENGKLDDATSFDGHAYTALPAAFKFQKSFDASCTCKPPGQSWVQALADAEKMLEQHSGDVTVTDKMSEDMARPKMTPVPDAKKGSKAARPAVNYGSAPTPENAAALEGLRGSQVPTASNASADIGPSPDGKTPVVKRNEGATRQISTRDGTKKVVRVVEP